MAGFESFDVDISMARGERRFQYRFATSAKTVTLSGPSGVGKTTLLRALAGLEDRVQGRIIFEGECWLESDKGIFLPPWRRSVGWMPQDAICFPHLSVLENLLFAKRASTAEARLLAGLLGIEKLLQRRIRHLSGGERQRVALGRTLLAKPRLLLLDEPFSAIESERRRELIAFVAETCAKQEARLILVSHGEEELAWADAEHRSVHESGLLV